MSAVLDDLTKLRMRNHAEQLYWALKALLEVIPHDDASCPGNCPLTRARQLCMKIEAPRDKRH